MLRHWKQLLCGCLPLSENNLDKKEIELRFKSIGSIEGMLVGKNNLQSSNIGNSIQKPGSAESIQTPKPRTSGIKYNKSNSKVITSTVIVNHNGPASGQRVISTNLNNNSKDISHCQVNAHAHGHGHGH